MTPSIVWDDTYGRLKALWGLCGKQFPLRVCRASRPFVPMIDAGRSIDGPAEMLFVSAVLGCGHVVRVPLERAERPGRPGKYHRLLPCYKCWMAEGNSLLLGCSFCGEGHPLTEPCFRHAGI